MASLQSNYTWRDRLFGPTITEEDHAFLQIRADIEGWMPLLAQVYAMKSRRKQRWFLAYIRDGLILVYPVGEDPYEDDDPWQQEL